MNTTPTQEEGEKDLADTEKDINFLHNILVNLHSFQSNAQPGDDRKFVKLDVMRYQRLLDEARDLRTKITAFLFP